MQDMTPNFPAGFEPAWNAPSRGSGLLDENAALPPVLIQYWQAAIRWRWLIGGIILASIMAGIAVTMLQAPQFTASSRLQISREQKNITNMEGLEGPAYPYDMEFYQTQYALLRAESLAELVVRKLNLAQDASFFAAHGVREDNAGAASGEKAALSANERKERERLAAGLLLRNVKIAPLRSSSLVDVSYTSRSPEWSAKIANAWPQAFIAATIDQQFASTADARRYLEDRLNGLRTKLEKSERDLIAFGNEHNIVQLNATRDAKGKTEEPHTLVASNLDALNQALMSARTERISAESRLQTDKTENSVEALGNQAIATLRGRRAEIAADYARLLVQYEPGFPAARALKEQIATLDTAIAREMDRVRGSRRLAYDEAVKRENELSAQVQSAKGQFDQQQRDAIQYNIYQREVDTNRQLFDSLLQRYKEISVAGTVGATNIVVVDRANVPVGPSAPSLRRNILIAIVFAIALALAAVFALEQIDEGIRNPADVEKMLRLPLLGNIPLTGGTPPDDLADSKTPISEAYFSVWTTLALATSHGFPTSLMVTSAQPGEGKSLTALALARSVGRTGKRVLLVDADLRAPSVHRLVQGDNSKGLSNILAGDDNFDDLIQTSNVKGLAILPAGPNPPSAAELLSTDRIETVFAKLAKRFDHIVVDAPPVIGIADAPLLARAVEGCVFVIEADKVALRTIRNALKRLQVGSIHILGAIVTKVENSRYRYGYGYGYGYGDSFEYGGDKREAELAPRSG